MVENSIKLGMKANYKPKPLYNQGQNEQKHIKTTDSTPNNHGPHMDPFQNKPASFTQ